MNRPSHADIKVLLFSFSELGLLAGTLESLGSTRAYEIHVLACHSLKWIRHSNRVTSHHAWPSPDSKEIFTDKLTELIKTLGIDVLLPVDSGATQWIVKHQNCLRHHVLLPPLPRRKHLALSRSKSSFYEQAKALGIRTPRTLVLQDVNSLQEAAIQLKFPMIIKPDAGQGGNRIRRFNHPSEIESFATSGPDMKGFLAQEYCDGSDASLLCLADEGQVYAMSLRARWWDAPGRSEFSYLKNFRSMRCPWIEAIGVDMLKEIRFSGIANFDLRYDEDQRQAVFFEMDSRMIATQVGTHFFGVNIADLLIRKATRSLSVPACCHTEEGHFLAASLVGHWLKKMDWQIRPKTNFFLKLKDPRLLAAQSWSLFLRKIRTTKRSGAKHLPVLPGKTVRVHPS